MDRTDVPDPKLPPATALASYAQYATSAVPRVRNVGVPRHIHQDLFHDWVELIHFPREGCRSRPRLREMKRRNSPSDSRQAGKASDWAERVHHNVARA